MNTLFVQKTFQLPPYPRGFHIISDRVLKEIPEIKDFGRGMLHVYIKHTSASLTINENADPTVLADFESHMNVVVPENAPYYRHTMEGPDDMPAHIKASLMGSSVLVPVTDGNLAFGTWQGIYLCEHRNRAGGRYLVLSLWGNKH